MKIVNKTMTLPLLLQVLCAEGVSALGDNEGDLSEVLVNVQVWEDLEGAYNGGINETGLDGLFLVSTGCTKRGEVESAVTTCKRPYVTVDDRSKNVRLVYRIG